MADAGNIIYRRIGGRVVPIKLDEKNKTRAAKNIQQKVGVGLVASGSASTLIHEISRASDYTSRKLIQKSFKANNYKVAEKLHKFRSLAKSIKRKKLGIIGYGLAGIGSLLIAKGALRRSRETRAIRNEELESKL